MQIMITAGYKIFMVIVFLAVARMIFPFEFPFATNLYFPEILSKIIANIRTPRFGISDYLLSFWNFFEIIWIMGILICLIYYFHSYWKFRKTIPQIGTDITEQEEYITLLDEICRENQAKNNFRVYRLPLINTPMISGLRKPYILLPEHLKATPKELYYILCHETAHYLHHDLVIKFFIQILCMIYWWNPACRLLKEQLNHLLEIRVDEHVIAMKTVSHVEYLECLLQVLKNSVSEKEQMFTISLCNSDAGLLKQRFQMMMHKKTGIHKYLLEAGILASVMTLYSVSYLFILEADYISPEIEKVAITTSINNTYLIKNPDGTYDVYYNSQYIETTDSLEYYGKDLRIYESIQEAKEQWEK